mgnify:CR=1 FL=1
MVIAAEADLGAFRQPVAGLEASVSLTGVSFRNGTLYGEEAERNTLYCAGADFRELFSARRRWPVPPTASCPPYPTSPEFPSKRSPPFFSFCTSFPWSDIYSTDGTVSSSDRRGKKEVDYGMGRYSGLFDRSSILFPISFAACRVRETVTPSFVSSRLLPLTSNSMLSTLCRIWEIFLS